MIYLSPLEKLVDVRIRQGFIYDETGGTRHIISAPSGIGDLVPGVVTYASGLRGWSDGDQLVSWDGPSIYVDGVLVDSGTRAVFGACLKIINGQRVLLRIDEDSVTGDQSLDYAFINLETGIQLGSGSLPGILGEIFQADLVINASATQASAIVVLPADVSNTTNGKILSLLTFSIDFALNTFALSATDSYTSVFETTTNVTEVQEGVPGEDNFTIDSNYTGALENEVILAVDYNADQLVTAKIVSATSSGTGYHYGFDPTESQGSSGTSSITLNIAGFIIALTRTASSSDEWSITEGGWVPTSSSSSGDSIESLEVIDLGHATFGYVTKDGGGSETTHLVINGIEQVV